jgi:hypothetical protein
MFFGVMITYHSHMKNTYNLINVVIEIFRNSKYNFRMFKFQESFARCKWAIMCMEYEQSCGM